MAIEEKETWTVCCICGNSFIGYGNLPFPVKESGYCCNECNFNVVIPARMKLYMESK